MSEQAANVLKRRLAAAKSWPIPAEAKVRGLLSLWDAFRESDDERLRRVAQWPTDRQYFIDPLPPKIPEAYAAMLWGEEPEIKAAEPNDQEALDELGDENKLTTQLREAEESVSAEGEYWWRISTDLDVSTRALLTWHSRADVVPYLNGRNVVAAAFVTRLYDPTGGDDDKSDVYRHIEIQSRGRVENVLYRGQENLLGDPTDLGNHPDTADLRPVWDHGIQAVLAGRIHNKFGRVPHCGLSDFKGVWSLFLMLNEGLTIGRENMRLTAKKRASVPSSLVRARPAQPGAQGELVDRGDGSMVPRQPAGEVDLGEDLFVRDELDVTEGGKAQKVFEVLEYSFDAEALTHWQDKVVEWICLRADLVPQFIGMGDFGSAPSGTALRVRLLPTVNAAEAKARPWDDWMPAILSLLQQVDALPRAEGGLGNDWTNPQARPSVQRETVLPEDETETATRHSTLKTADLISIEQSVRERYPDWTDDQVNAELDRIRADQKASAGPPIFAGGSADGGGGPAPFPSPGPGG